MGETDDNSFSLYSPEPQTPWLPPHPSEPGVSSSFTRFFSHYPIPHGRSATSWFLESPHPLGQLCPRCSYTSSHLSSLWHQELHKAMEPLGVGPRSTIIQVEKPGHRFHGIPHRGLSFQFLQQCDPGLPYS